MIKKTFSAVIMLALSLIVSQGIAQDTPTKDAPDVIQLKMGKGSTSFQHKNHQIKMKNECYHCHKTKTGIIDNWSEESAHVLCIACHDLYDNGPLECKGCHTK
jgi:hypothetical protein